MESFFHGASSGIDPLTSYLGMPLRIHDKTQVATVQPAQWAADAPLVFLVDTQQPRRTGPLVQWFLERSGTADFGGALEQTYLPAHEQLVEGWLRADPLLFWPNLERASQFQFEHFEPMIPAGIRPLWQRSLERPGVSLKICGAGGGGFLLGFARSKAEAEALCQGWETIFLPPNP
jgi:mevalonate kinase